MNVIGAEHTCYTVTDLESARLFYCELLGFEVAHARPRITNRYFRDIIGIPDAIVRDLYLRIPGTDHHLELFVYEHPAGEPMDNRPQNPGSSHIAYVVDDLRALHRRLKTQGLVELEFISEPVYLDEGPNRGGWALYLRDPNGIILELFEKAPET